MRCSASSTAGRSTRRRPSGPGAATSAATSSVDSARLASPPRLARDELAHLAGDVERQLAEAALLVGERAVDERAQLGLAERLEAHHLAARQQRGVDLERRVLRGRADERDRARLDVRQERVLLRLVEAVDLVEEQDGALAVLGQARLGLGDGVAQVLDARLHRREPDEARVGARGEDARQRRLARARRPPEDERGQHPLRGGALENPPRADQVRLADELVEVARAHPLGERLAGAALFCSVTEQIHGHGYSTT